MAGEGISEYTFVDPVTEKPSHSLHTMRRMARIATAENPDLELAFQRNEDNEGGGVGAVAGCAMIGIIPAAVTLAAVLIQSHR